MIGWAIFAGYIVVGGFCARRLFTWKMRGQQRYVNSEYSGRKSTTDEFDTAAMMSTVFGLFWPLLPLYGIFKYVISSTPEEKHVIKLESLKEREKAIAKAEQAIKEYGFEKSTAKDMLR